MNAPTSTRDGSSVRSVSAKQIVIALLGVLAIVFIFQNTAKGTVNFLWIDITAPGWLWLLIVFLVGGAVGWVAHSRRAH